MRLNIFIIFLYRIHTVLCLERIDGVLSKFEWLLDRECVPIVRNWLGWGLIGRGTQYITFAGVWLCCEQQTVDDGLIKASELVGFERDSLEAIRTILSDEVVVAVGAARLWSAVDCVGVEDESKLSRLLILIKFDANKGLRSPAFVTVSKLCNCSTNWSLTNIESVHCWIRPDRTRS